MQQVSAVLHVDSAWIPEREDISFEDAREPLCISLRLGQSYQPAAPRAARSETLPYHAMCCPHCPSCSAQAFKAHGRPGSLWPGRAIGWLAIGADCAGVGSWPYRICRAREAQRAVWRYPVDSGIASQDFGDLGVMLKEQLVHETLDGETIVIDLAAGTYYSMERSAADLWARLVAGQSLKDSAADLAARHGADIAALTSAVADFHRELFAHGLVTEQPQAGSAAGGDLGTFELPQIRVYDDLREHLLLDPIHDVERGSGWPAASTGA
ncbi:MAG: PqqD family protein [Mycobacterium sp.]|nr:MAG: PqqD family protein [Mycobacterium sp.]